MALHKLEKQLRDCEETLLHTDFSQRRAMLEDLLAPDFIEFGVTGRINKRESVLEWLLNKDKNARWLFSDFRIQACNNEMAVVIYHAIQQGKEDVSKGALHSSVWQWSAELESWQMVFHQASKTQ